MAWTVASDIADRIRDLREFLGGNTGRPVRQEELALRAGVRTAQVSQWERGAQRPSRSRLERWAEREGWPVEIFEEGAPMPTSVLPAPLVVTTPFPAQPGTDPVATDPNQLLARFYEVMAEASRQGRPCPPELAALIQQMHGLALRPESRTPTSASGTEPSTSTDPDQSSEVPGW